MNRITSIGLVALGISLGSALQAQVVISDSFAGGGDGVTIVGRTPETNLPGDVWAKATNQSSFGTTSSAGFGNPLPGVFGTPQSGSGILLASFGSYVKPAQFRIAADLAPRDIVGLANEFRGIALGFYSAVGAGQQFSQNLFTGLVLDSTGSVSLVSDPNLTGFLGAGTTASPSIPFVGAFDPLALSRLSYDVNTNTGQVSNISLSGSSADYSTLSTYILFTDTATTYAGMYTSSAASMGFGALDNFVVTAVPEPGSITLLLTTGLGLLALRRRHACGPAAPDSDFHVRRPLVARTIQARNFTSKSPASTDLRRAKGPTTSQPRTSGPDRAKVHDRHWSPVRA